MSGPHPPRRRLPCLVLLLLLAACGREQARPAPSPSPPPPRSTASPTASGGVGCFSQLDVAPATGTPAITQAEAGARERALAATSPVGPQGEQPGALLEARAVTVIASGLRANGADALRGRDVWVLVFAFTPRDQPATLPVVGGETFAWRTYAIVDADTGTPLASCTSPLPVNRPYTNVEPVAHSVMVSCGLPASAVGGLRTTPCGG